MKGSDFLCGENDDDPTEGRSRLVVFVGVGVEAIKSSQGWSSGRV